MEEDIKPVPSTSFFDIYEDILFHTSSSPQTRSKTASAKKDVHVKGKSKPKKTDHISFGAVGTSNMQQDRSTDHSLLAFDQESVEEQSCTPGEPSVADTRIMGKISTIDNFDASTCCDINNESVNISGGLINHTNCNEELGVDTLEDCREMNDSNKKSHQCTLCQKTFTHKGVLTNHMKMRTCTRALTKENKTHLCFVCGKVFTYSFELNKHLQSHSDEITHQCVMCQKSFKTRYELLMHTKKIHCEEKSYLCQVCGKVFATKTNLTGHMIIHSNDRLSLECYICLQTFKTKCGLNGHIKRHTTGIMDKNHLKVRGNNTFEQSQTEISGMTSGNSSGNQKVSHSAAMKFQCSFCNKVCKDISKLNEHLRVHTKVKPYQCSICQRRFSHSAALRRHMIGQHNGKNMLHRCSFCSEGFSQKGLLKEHIMETHGLEVSEALRRSQTVTNISCSSTTFGSATCQEEKKMQPQEILDSIVAKFQCRFCQKVCKDISKLKEHLRVHTKETPYECSICPRRFSTSSALRKHMIVKHGSINMLHKCSFCSEGFSRKGLLKKHNVESHRSEISALKRSHTVTDISGTSTTSDGPTGLEANTMQAQEISHSVVTINQCNFCEKECYSIYELKEHLRVHTKEKPYQCDAFKHSQTVPKTDILSNRSDTSTGQETAYEIAPSTMTKFQCRFCQKQCKNIHHLDEHLRVHTKETPFQCPRCQKRFGYMCSFRRHMIRKHGAKHCCTFCSMGFSRKELLRRHIMDSHGGQKPLKCDICQSEFSQRTRLHTHMLKAHKLSVEEVPLHSSSLFENIPKENEMSGMEEDPARSEVSYNVEMAGETTEAEVNNLTPNNDELNCEIKYYIVKHSITAQEEKSVINIHVVKNDYNSVDASNLVSHYVGEHTQTQTPRVNYVYVKEPKKYNDQIKQHINDIKEASYSCTLCGNVFSRDEDLITHIQSHSVKLSESSFQCLFCKKLFESVESINSHIIIHTKVRPFKCCFCWQSFGWRSGLRSHMMGVHKDKTGLKYLLSENIFTQITHHEVSSSETIVSDLALKLEEKLLQRSQVSYIVVAETDCEGNQKRQNITILERDRGQCHLCGAWFDAEEELRTHMKTHSKLSEKDYRCSFCQKSFTKMKNFNNHMFTHTKERSEKCRFCTKTFTLKNVLKKHMKVVHKQDERLPFVLQEISEPTVTDAMKIPTKEKPYQCSICQRVFSFKNVMTKHMLTVHLKERRHQCPVCQMTFRYHRTMKEHAERIHNDVKLNKSLLSVSRRRRNENDSIIHQQLLNQNIPNQTTSKRKSDGVGTKTQREPSRNHDLNFVDLLEACEYDSINHCDDDDDTIKECSQLLSNDSALQKHELVQIERPRQSSSYNHSLNENSPYTANRTIHRAGKITYLNSINVQNYKNLCGSDKQAGKELKNKPYHCTVCGKAFSKRKYIIPHMRTHTGEKPYQCSVCNKTFSDGSCARKHLKTHQKPLKSAADRPYACTLCEKRYTRLDTLTQHMKVHSGQKRKCTRCEKMFESRGGLNKHLRLHHGTNCFDCTLCEKSFNLRSLLRKHMKSHKVENSYQCSICQKEYKFNSGLKIHMRIHSGENLLECPTCDKKFVSNIGLRKHLPVHNTWLKCNMCAETFASRDILKSHMKSHFPCLICHKNFNNRFKLNEHMTVHTKEKPYQCTNCQKRFSYTSSLKKHMKIHSREAIYKCPICLKGFCNSSILKRHLTIHSEDTKYECSVCKLPFSSFVALEYHTKVHTGQEPYQCSVCNKAFANNGNLKLHIASVHNGDNLIKCILCKREFLHRKWLKRHVRDSHAGDKCHKCSVCQKEFFHAGTLKFHMVKCHTDKLLNVQSDLDEQNESHPEVTHMISDSSTIDNHNISSDTEGGHSAQKQEEEYPHVSTINDESSIDGEYENLDELFEDGPGVCSICNKEFSTKAALGKHMKIHTQRVVQVQCLICSRVLKSIYSLKVHMKIHKGEKPFNCSVCQKKFMTRHLLKTHMVTHTIKHDNDMLEKRITVLNENDNLRKHIITLGEISNSDTPGDTEVSCETSGNSPRKQELSHSAATKFQCSFCKKVCKDIHKLEEHLRVHTKEKPYECSICKRKFSHSSALRKHMKALHGYHKNYMLHICSICSEGFSRKGQLTDHIMESHGDIVKLKTQNSVASGVKTHRSEIVAISGKSSSQDTNTTEKPGTTIHENDNSQKTITILKDNNKSKQLPTAAKRECNICGKFVKITSLANHMNIHAEASQEDHLCNVCGRSFTRERYLKQHMRYHNPDGKSFQCETCGKAFVEKYEMVRHARLHSGEKPFQCPLCSKAFRLKFRLRFHMMDHHPVAY